MTIGLVNLLQLIMGLLAGGLIGYWFGLIQDAARRRNEQRQASGRLKSGWAVMPGSGRRVVYLMFALVLVQAICPLLFRDGVQWWVSAGVAGGYGLTLFRQLAHKRTRGS